MADTALYEQEIVERDIVSPAAGLAGTPFSWSAAIAGVLAATAVSFIIIALGSGIGLSFASPFGSGPSATALTLLAAVWLVMAEAMGFATGGYLAARLRSPAYDGVVGETAFRDGAEGLVVWALGVVIIAALTGGLAILGAGAGVHLAASAASGTGAAPATAAANTPTDYLVDLMFRPAPAAAAAGPGPQASPRSAATVGIAAAGPQPLTAETRAEVSRILVRSVSQGKLDDNDRAYLAQLVSMRTGLPADQAAQRVSMVENDAREAADKAAKAAAYFSFWTFMALLFGGAAATLGGILGGQLRDAEDTDQFAATS